MLYCSSECGSISIMQVRTIYCNTHVYTFHVCLCLLALTFVCNSTYLLKCSFQIYQKSIVVFIRSSKVWFKTTSCDSISWQYIMKEDRDRELHWRLSFTTKVLENVSACQFHVVSNGQGCGPPSPRGRVSIPSWAKSTFKLVSEGKKKD